MHLSLRWLNDLLAPGDLSAAQAEDILMNLGFPIETWEGDTFDLEVTSNRGDMLCHLGAAREVAAKTGRTLKMPAPELREDAGAGAAGEHLTLINATPEVCPLFTARVIRGVKVGPSPAWLREKLEAVGQRSINNVVDVTNFINFELGNPCHAFDLAKLEGRTLHIRWAKDKEPLTTLDGKKRTLAKDELVVADASKATSLAGVIGGGDSEVSESTTDVVLEIATWDPATVRRASRRHQVRTDASHRFERIVDPRTIALALDRGAALIAQVSGGRVCPGVLAQGRPLPEPTRIRFRPRRCTALLGIEVGVDDMVRYLNAVGVEVGPMGRGGEELLCAAPAHRPDLTREVDLIEEVARLHGLDNIPINDKMLVAVRPPQAVELARREMTSLLTGLGFYETVTFSFTTPKDAAMFMPQGVEEARVDDERRGGEPSLRPSVLTGLLTVRRKNQHAQVRVPGGVRLFEVASIFGQSKAEDTGRETGATQGRTIETTTLALLADVAVKGKTASTGELQHGVRSLRGVIESLVTALAGTKATLEFAPISAPYAPAFEPSSFANIRLNGQQLGYLSLLTKATLAHYDLSTPVVVAELNLPLLLAQYPPKGSIAHLPEFPGIERDLSVVVDERVAWKQIEDAVRGSAKPPLEHVEFVTTFRAEKLGKGKKSVTLRLSFREPGRTLRHEEVDAPVAGVVEALKSAVGAELRA
ncbi:MAG TPA: phenylalanine--tRNA ligase subunit beta [Phycisphaerales bacterium]|nr:phenylalanine--tRNA ligase subunit beta [Phycisphaerales bacterium]